MDARGRATQERLPRRRNRILRISSDYRAGEYILAIFQIQHQKHSAGSNTPTLNLPQSGGGKKQKGISNSPTTAEF
jgi:hypothetical protein